MHGRGHPTPDQTNTNAVRPKQDMEARTDEEHCTVWLATRSYGFMFFLITSYLWCGSRSCFMHEPKAYYASGMFLWLTFILREYGLETTSSLTVMASQDVMKKSEQARFMSP